MKKVFALMLGCFMVLGVTVAKADVRTDSLGLTAGQQVDDIDNIWLFPQDAARNGNIVDFRLGFTNGATNDNWGGIIHKDWDDIGYVGIYTNRPFDQNNGNAVAPNTPAINQNGILDGANPWRNLISPFRSANFYAEGSSAHGRDDFNNINAHYVFINVFNADEQVNTPENKLDLFWAKESGDTTFGVHINYAANNGNNAISNEDGSVTGTFTPNGTPAANTTLAVSQNDSATVLGLDLGLGLKNLGAFDSLDLGVGYSLGTVDFKYIQTRETNAGTGTEAFNTNTIKDNNISSIRLNALAKSKINDNATGRIYANARLDNLGFNGSRLDDNNNNNVFTDAGEVRTASNTYTDTNFNFGIACDHKVADGKAHVIAGVGFIFDDQNWKESSLANLAGNSTADQVQNGSGSTEDLTQIQVPVNIAVEAPLFDWLKARVGASHVLYQNATAKVTQLTNANAGGTAYQDTTTVSVGQDLTTDLNMSYGVSAQFQNFTLDLQVSQNAFENYLSGFRPGDGIFYNGGAANNLFTQADLRYAF